MAKILIAYAGTAPVISVVHLAASQLREVGHCVTLAPAETAPDVRHFDAVVVGSELFRHHWVRAVINYLKDQAPDLAERPTFLFECVTAKAETFTPHNVQRLAFEIGTALPRTFETEKGTVRSRAAVEAWAHSIDAALSSRVEGLPTGYWAAADAVAVP